MEHQDLGCSLFCPAKRKTILSLTINTLRASEAFLTPAEVLLIKVEVSEFCVEILCDLLGCGSQMLLTGGLAFRHPKVRVRLRSEVTPT